MSKANYLTSAERTIKLEAEALLNLTVDERFCEACELIIKSRGRLIITGMGKSGHIGTKLAATFASTGTPAFFVHPGEASHGDLGMITREDVVLALSNSGESNELTSILPSIKRIGAPLIAMTGNPESALAQYSDVLINTYVEKEACPLNLAPTSSTTAQLAMGDAMAIALMEARSFRPDDFAMSHPGGRLGRRLLLTVADLMHTGPELPVTYTDITLAEALLEMTNKTLGMTTVIHRDSGCFAGVFTDGDLRRALQQYQQPLEVTMADLIRPSALTINRHDLAAEALRIMEEKQITSLVCLDASSQPEGVVHLHDLLKAGIA